MKRPWIPGLLALALSVATAGCGPDSYLPPRRSRVAGLGTDNPWFGTLLKRFWSASLPAVDHGQWAPPGGPSGLVVNVLPREVVLLGRTWSTGPGSPAERESWGRDLRSELTIRCLPDAVHDEALHCPATLVVHADAGAPWSVVEDLLRVAVTEVPSFRRVAFCAASRGSPRDRILGAEATPLGIHGSEPGALAVELRTQGSWEDERRHSITLSIGRMSWTLDPAESPDSAEAPAILEQGPRPGRLLGLEDAAARLAELAPAGRAVSLRVVPAGGAARWGHVAQVLDLLVGAGLRKVDLPDAGVVLTLAAPEHPAAERGPSPPDPVWTPGILLAVALLAASAFLATLAPLAARDVR